MNEPEVWTADPPEHPSREVVYQIRDGAGRVSYTTFKQLDGAWYTRDGWASRPWAISTTCGWQRSVLPVPSAERNAALEALYAAVMDIDYVALIARGEVPPAYAEALVRLAPRYDLGDLQ